MQLDLLPFGQQALDHFLFLERPEGMDCDDAAEFVATAPPRDPVDQHETLPRGQEFATVGHLYRGIADGLRGLASRLGERALFVGSPRAQATPELFHWPQLVAVTDLESALAAVEEIIEQGEGAQGNWNEAHYGRFLSVRQEYEALRQADPSFDPVRPVLAAFLRQPFDIPTPRPVVTHPRARQVAELAGLAYELTLHVLLRFFTHTDETDAQLGILVNASMALMARVLHPLGTELTTPAGRLVPPWPHGRLRVRDVLRDGQHDTPPRAGLGPARRTCSHPRPALPPGRGRQEPRCRAVRGHRRRRRTSAGRRRVADRRGPRRAPAAPGRDAPW